MFVSIRLMYHIDVVLYCRIVEAGIRGWGSVHHLLKRHTLLSKSSSLFTIWPRLLVEYSEDPRSRNHVQSQSCESGQVNSG